MNREISGSYETLDAGEVKPSLGGSDDGLEVLGAATIAVEPGQDALDYPSAGQHLEALRGVGAPDDLDSPAAKAARRRRQLVAATDAVSKQAPQPGKGGADGAEQIRAAVTVLDVGGMNGAGDQQAAGVGDDVALAPLDPLAGVELPRAAAFGGLDRLAIADAGVGASLSYCQHQVVVDALPDAVVALGLEVVLHCGARRELLRQWPPPVADQRPFAVRDVTRVAEVAPVIFGASDFSPRVVSPVIMSATTNHNRLKLLNSLPARHSLEISPSSLGE